MQPNPAEDSLPIDGPAAQSPPRAVLGIFVLALVAYGVTAHLRLLDALASFDVANALLLGLFARLPAWRTPRNYAAVGAASLLAAWSSGHPLDNAVLLALADTAGIVTGTRLLARLPLATLQLRREHSPLFVLLACLAASATTTLLALPVTLVQVEHSLSKALALSMSTEFMNHVLIVPMVLGYASHFQRHWRRAGDWLPLIGLLASEMLATLIGGPGAIAFTLPAFIWCALRYTLFPTAVLFALFTLWKCQAFAMGHSSMTSAYFADVASLRIGLSLLWLGPLTVACSQTARNEVLQRLSYASQHDHLTDTLVRRTFVQRGETALARARAGSAPLAMLMLDIDHFKQVNDQHGHATGDIVLRGFAATISHLLRHSDLAGRYGGEEFCVCLPGLSLQDSLIVAERLRSAVLAQTFTTTHGDPLHITVSIGLCHYSPNALPATVDAALAQADALLYRAKQGGRNRVEHASITSPQPAPSGCLSLVAASAALPLKG